MLFAGIWSRFLKGDKMSQSEVLYVPRLHRSTQPVSPRSLFPPCDTDVLKVCGKTIQILLVSLEW